MTDECRPPESTGAGTFLEFWTHVNEVRAANGDKPMPLADANRAWLIRENDKLRAELAEARAAVRDAAQCRVDSTAIAPDWWHERHAAAIARAQERRP